MRAMVMNRPGQPLEAKALPTPQPGAGQLRVKVRTCGVCRTDLHVVDGELPRPNLPLVPGHQIVGEVDAIGPPAAGSAAEFQLGQRVGIPWLGATCGHCSFCSSQRENLCPDARFTGYQLAGGYAEYTVADARYCFALPEGYDDRQAAPLLCAGLIGYRALRMTGEARRLGFYGFGAAAHILTQVACAQGRQVFAFTRRGDERSQRFARSLGACWAGASDDRPPELLDAAIIFAPIGALVPAALGCVQPGGKVVCAGIHMSDLPSFPYELLWMERSVQSVANLTRRDALEFLPLAAETGVRTEVHPFPLERANEALDALRAGRFDGAAVLDVTLPADAETTPV